MKVGDPVTFTFPVGGIWRAVGFGVVTRIGKRVSVAVESVEDEVTFFEHVGKIKHLKACHIKVQE
jgi:hypothetical protein